MDAAGESALTDARYWDRYWEDIGLPREVRWEAATPYIREILRVFERHLPRGEGRAALEVGGAPGQYLAWVQRRLGYAGATLDFSPVGCRKTRRNFELLGLPIDVYEVDLFEDDPAVPRFDLVFSLGLIEHFDDPLPAVARHARLIRPGGTLLIGCPNYRGITRLFMRRLSPALLARHNLQTMDLRRWNRFESELGLERVSRGYVGGFEPSLLRAREPLDGPLDRLLDLIARALHAALGRRLALLRRVNSRWTSGYAIGVWRVSDPGD